MHLCPVLFFSLAQVKPCIGLIKPKGFFTIHCKPPYPGQSSFSPYAISIFGYVKIICFESIACFVEVVVSRPAVQEIISKLDHYSSKALASSIPSSTAAAPIPPLNDKFLVQCHLGN